MKRNFLIYLVSNSINSLIPFIFIPILTRYISPSEYAIIGIFIALSGIFSAFTGLGLHAAVRVNFFKRDKKDFKTYVSNVLIIIIFWSSITLAVVTALSTHISNMLDISEKVIILAVLLSISQFFIQTTLALFQAEEKAFKFALIQTTQVVLNFSISIILLVYIEQGYEGRINGVLYSSTIVSILSIYFLYKRGFSIFSYSKEHVKSALNFGLPLVPHVFIISLIPVVDRFVLANQVTLESVGLYFLAFQLAMPVKILCTSINLAFMPWCFRNMKNKNDGLIVVATYITMLLILTSSVVYIFLLVNLLPYLVPQDYQSSPELIYMLVAANIFHGFYLLTAKSFTYTEKIKQMSAITILSGIFYIFVIYLIAGDFKEFGVAFSKMAHGFFVFVLVWFFANKIYPQPWFDVRIIKNTSTQLISRNIDYIKNR